jgi:Uma2 family endonuclease
MTTRTGPRTDSDHLWTEAEFLALPESNNRIELLDGELIREPAAGFGHGQRQHDLTHLLKRWARSRTPRPDVADAPLDVRFADRRILQPDIVVFLVPLPRPVRTPIAVVPDLCVELVSRNRSYDRVMKRMVYAEAGVREYWTVIPELGFVERWTGERLATSEECRERLVTPLLPGFELDVIELLKEP